jgi:hypothetical protein
MVFAGKQVRPHPGMPVSGTVKRSFPFMMAAPKMPPSSFSSSAPVLLPADPFAAAATNIAATAISAPADPTDLSTSFGDISSNNSATSNSDGQDGGTAATTTTGKPTLDDSLEGFALPPVGLVAVRKNTTLSEVLDTTQLKLSGTKTKRIFAASASTSYASGSAGMDVGGAGEADADTELLIALQPSMAKRNRSAAGEATETDAAMNNVSAQPPVL